MYFVGSFRCTQIFTPLMYTHTLKLNQILVLESRTYWHGTQTPMSCTLRYTNTNINRVMFNSCLYCALDEWDEARVMTHTKKKWGRCKLFVICWPLSTQYKSVWLSKIAIYSSRNVCVIVCVLWLSKTVFLYSRAPKTGLIGNVYDETERCLLPNVLVVCS